MTSPFSGLEMPSTFAKGDPVDYETPEQAAERQRARDALDAYGKSPTEANRRKVIAAFAALASATGLGAAAFIWAIL